MTRIGSFLIAAREVTAVACNTPTPTAPSLNTGVSTSASAFGDSSAGGTLSTAAVNCTIDIGATTRPLPALHVLANWINASLSTSSLTCGQVRSLAAKLQQEVAALDQDPQHLAAACGISTGLLSELQ